MLGRKSDTNNTYLEEIFVFIAIFLCPTDILKGRNNGYTKLSKGIESCLLIQKLVQTTNIAESRPFQKLYNGFYCVRRDAAWQKVYYGFFEQNKHKNPSFKEIITHLYIKTGRVEASFASKMNATLNVDAPIWDQFVLHNLGLSMKPYYKNSSDKLNDSIRLYDKIVEWYQQNLSSEEWNSKVAIFDATFPNHRLLSKTKKIDFMLWTQTEEEPMSQEEDLIGVLKEVLCELKKLNQKIDDLRGNGKHDLDDINDQLYLINVNLPGDVKAMFYDD